MPTTVEIKMSPEAERLILRLENQRGLGDALCKTIDFQNELTVSYIQTQKLSGQALNRVSSRLFKSIRRSKAVIRGGEIVSSIGSNVSYAAIHEFGGTTKPHVILAKGKAMAFLVGGKMVFAKKVNHPGSKIPERSFIRTSLAERADDYSAALSKTVVNFYGGKK